MQAGIPSVQIVHLGLLDRGDHGLGDELDVMFDAGDVLEGIQEQGGAGAEQGTAFRGQDGAVLEFDGGGGGAGAGTVQAVLRRDRGHPVGRGDARPLHQEGDLVHLGFRGLAVGEVAQGRVVAADDFLQGGFVQ